MVRSARSSRACISAFFSRSDIIVVPSSIDMRNIIIVTSILFVLVLLLLPLGYQAVWDGHFDLRIIVDTHQPVDRSSFLFATCWHERDAVHAVQNSSIDEYGFRSPHTTQSGELLIDVPCSGREGAFGFGSTYNQPKYLVVEYRIDNNPPQPLRRRFSIPRGRGPRSMTIVIP
jgi:hypothetical protein